MDVNFERSQKKRKKKNNRVLEEAKFSNPKYLKRELSLRRNAFLLTYVISQTSFRGVAAWTRNYSRTGTIKPWKNIFPIPSLVSRVTRHSNIRKKRRKKRPFTWNPFSSLQFDSVVRNRGKEEKRGFILE